MHAVVMHDRGAAEVLRYETVPTPRAHGDEVLLRVEGATVNHTDIFHRTGQFFIQKPLPHILGMDVAGTVSAVGARVKHFHGGERVVATFEGLGRERDGGYAQYTVVPESELHVIPNGLDVHAAASIGLAFTTAWLALVETARLSNGDRLLVQGAASGVGTSAIQIARHAGAQVIAVAKPEKADRLTTLGAHLVLPMDTAHLPRMVKDATEGRGVTHVLDLVGRDTLATSISCLAEGGTVLCAGALSGDLARINVMELMLCRGHLQGIYGKLSPGSFETILDRFAQGVYQPVIDRVMPLRDAQEAHRLVENREVLGKIVLDPWRR
jgi:NADPH2:quinone reductase